MSDSLFDKLEAKKIKMQHPIYDDTVRANINGHNHGLDRAAITVRDYLNDPATVEAVARAICYSEAVREQKPLPFEYSNKNWEQFIEQAKAALALLGDA